ncbi:uncharacterized protein LOC110919458 [Helianthus annuus]|uniref:uncharacterized protein LOC110919458 n=1 Tax=Helianthus annuus TaxID=4232 RepID=UPI000B90894D|nr:uncharacterized protein LOC110919458 [Helianthus annuus]
MKLNPIISWVADFTCCLFDCAQTEETEENAGGWGESDCASLLLVRLFDFKTSSSRFHLFNHPQIAMGKNKCITSFFKRKNENEEQVKGNQGIVDGNNENKRQKASTSEPVSEVNNEANKNTPPVNEANNEVLLSMLSHARYGQESTNRVIPNLRRKLISVGKLDDEGFNVHFGGGQWKVIKGNLVIAKGKKQVLSLGGSRYYVTFIDDSTRKIWKSAVENETNLKVKCLKSDNGGEYISKQFTDYCAKEGIKMIKTVPGTPQ